MENRNKEKSLQYTVERMAEWIEKYVITKKD